MATADTNTHIFLNKNLHSNDGRFEDIFPQSWCGTPMKELLSKPLVVNSDFLSLAPECAGLVSELLETHSTTARLALTGRLNYALKLLLASLNGLLTKEQEALLTTEQKPAMYVDEAFSPDNEILCNYCLSLTEILLSCTVDESNQKNILGLLFELVNYLCDSLTTPRFYNSAEGLHYLGDDSLVLNDL
ncbi:hypothetical protein N7936_001641 [Cronobacter sakazakii]|uniref:hypothetical protein n=1 Tax=Cronobacter sakazakii TaxID=28141 RepID=UPI001319D009|nr:hypothetical protein [Cronobacter sakazakii]EIZ8992394.1 hypothetical protein [Cronobacter sakazakii]EJV9472832.1 hypothetical protein [Cronobacter sakazakii]